MRTKGWSWQRVHHRHSISTMCNLYAMTSTQQAIREFTRATREWEDTKPRKTPTWFALSEDRPLFCFAGIWTNWTGTRGTKADSVTGEHRLFGFLTTEPNAEVRPIHPKAMPVILKTPAEIDAWLTAPWGEVASMQRPLIDGTLKVVARNIRADG